MNNLKILFNTKLPQKILIIGDSGRGKSTFAKKLSEKIHIPLHSTDDFFWKVKFSEPNDREESIQKITQIYSQDTWIVEGGTTHLIKPGLDKADVILNLTFKNIFLQYWSLIKRNQGRENENIFNHLLYVTKKRFGIGNNRRKKQLELLKPYAHKIYNLKSYRELDEILQSL